MNRIQNRVVLVVGLPASGKSTLIENQRVPGDIVISYDQLLRAITRIPDHIHPMAALSPDDRRALIPVVMAARSAILESLIAGDLKRFSGTVWITATATEAAKIEVLARRLGAAVIEMNADRETCLSRAKSDSSRQGQDARVAEAIDHYESCAKKAGSPRDMRRWANDVLDRRAMRKGSR